MAEKPEIFEARLKVQLGYLERLESRAKKVFTAPAFDLAEYEVGEFSAYSGKEDVERIIIDMKDRNDGRDIRIVEHALVMARTAIQLIETQMAAHYASGKVISPKASLEIHNDEKAFAGLMWKVDRKTETMVETHWRFEPHEITKAMHDITTSFMKAMSDNSMTVPKQADLPELTRKTYDLRAACLKSAMEISELRLITLDAQIDFVALLRKATDEGITESDPHIDNMLRDHCKNIAGDVFLIHENISFMRSFLQDFVKTGAYDPMTGEFKPQNHEHTSIQPLVYYIP